MLKFKRVNGVCERGPDIMGMYHPVIGQAELFLEAIRREAIESGSSFRDLVALVRLHEEAHHLHHVSGITKSIPNFIEVEEQLADEYAVKMFRRRYHRIPRVSNW